MIIFEARNLVKYFGGLSAVKGVGFQVEEGEIFGLIGPNGSGKTTIFNLINHFFPLTSGEFFFRGQKITGLSTHKICKLGIARTFQVVKPLARMTVLDHVIASAFCRENTLKHARKLALETIQFCGLEAYQDQTAKSLPIGLRKRLEITRALATKPKVLLLDETCAGLNPKEVNKAIELIKKINQQGVTIIIIEHIMKVIMTISKRILAINHGQPITEGTPEEVSRNPQVIEAYLGEEYAQGQ
ncbi:MAG: ABC transporter ATP-binding protein [Deltaproteobacteria bacterium RBG_13_43_22]|nr:MAG: ABC transporter ATP-binding protein [Deltaproteobacteria bacterium RBG_13_43_22]